MTSPTTAFVRPVIALPKFSGSVGSTKETSIPICGNVAAKKGIRPPVEMGRGHDVVARARQRHDGGCHRRLTARGGDGGHSSLHLRHPFLKDVDRRVGDAGVDVARLVEGEELLSVASVDERIGSRLVDRHRRLPVVGSGA